jgi:hypothetical protein
MTKLLNAIVLIILLPISFLIFPIAPIIWVLLVWSVQSHFNKQEQAKAIAKAIKEAQS